jgi:signal transduction histidine kinase
LQKALRLSGEQGHEKLPVIYNSLANVCSYTGRIEEALAYYLKALSAIGEGKEVAPKRAKVLNNIASLYSEQGDFPQALKYLDQVDVIATQINDSLVRADNFNSYGFVYEQMDSIRRAMAYYERAAELYTALKLDDRISIVYNNLGVLNKNVENYDQALVYYNFSLLSAERIGDNFLVAANLNNIGNVLAKQQKFDEAIAQTQKALTMSIELGNPNLRESVLESLAEQYSGKGDYQNALEYYTKYKNLHDSIISDERVNALAEMDKKYESEKNKLTIEKLEVEQERVNLYNGILILALIMVVIVVFFGYRWYRWKQQQREWTLVQETEKSERERIAQDLHDELGSGISRIRWVTGSIQKETGIERAKLEPIEEVADQLSLGMRSLIWLLHVEQTGMKDLQSRIRELANRFADDCDWRIDWKEKGQSNLTLDQTAFRDVYLMLKEILHNAAKYGQTQMVSIGWEIDADGFYVQVFDHGVGFEPSTIKEGRGMGNLRHRAASHEGKVEINTAMGQGTTTTIYFPWKNIKKK